MPTWVKCTEIDETVLHVNLDNVLYLVRNNRTTKIYLAGRPEEEALEVIEMPDDIIEHIWVRDRT